ncbi:hypothetical protein [Saccharibacillus sacchari]|uniref:Uncharacterized protein n=1 Tax=Saccharibacillus sacchari TaxID=456493 RepID=A0ACC6P871_9BACL
MDSKDLFLKIIDTGTKINNYFGGMLETTIEYAPYIGRMVQTVKINRVVRRMKEHENKIDKIAKLAADSLLTSEYISERIFPIIFCDLFEEHEEAKINLILNGFENVFIEENSNESVIINFYDTLRTLRYFDLKRLFYFANTIDETINYSEDSDVHAMTRSVNKKLENMGLINVSKTWNDLDSGDSDKDREDIKISLYGQSFLNFIKESE